MENNGGSKKPRVFAAKYAYKWQGWTLIVLSLGTVNGFANARGTGAVVGAIISSIFGVIFLAVGIYLVRGQGQSPAQIQRAQRRADELEASIAEAAKKLQESKGGAAVVAHRNLSSLVMSTKLPNAEERLNEILASIKFDKSTIVSKHIGTIPKMGWLGTELEVYKDWVIYGQRAWDVDETTQGEVHLDGAIQIDAKGNKQDMRKASIQLVSTEWSETFQIHPDQATEARRIVAQLSAVSNSLKPDAVSGSEVKALLEAILAQNSQPAAEKLKQLSDLRYQRLLSDEEFEAAKAKVLGI